MREASDIERFELGEGGKEEGAGAASGIEDSELGESVEEQLEEIRLGDAPEEIEGEPIYSEVMGDALIDGMDSAGAESVMESRIAGAASGEFIV